MITAEVQPGRILMTADAVGGVWQYSVDLSRELAGRGCEVLLAVLGPAPSREQQNSAAYLAGVRCVHAPLALEWMERPWEDVARSQEWLLRLAKEFRPHVIHLNGYALADAPWDAPTLVVAHSCVVSWWQAVHGSEPPGEWQEYRTRVRAGLQASSAIAAPSRSMADSLASNYGIERGHITVIPNFASAEPAPQQRKEEVFLAAGRLWDKAKNLALLETIAPELVWPVTVAGSESQADEPAVSGLRHAGRLSHSALGHAMRRAAVFVHPALYEPFGLAVLEAARANCCLVLADIPSLRELWTDAALFVDPRDPAAWVRTLNGLARDKAMRREMARRALAHAECYRAADSTAAYLALYARAAQGSRTGAAA